MVGLSGGRVQVPVIRDRGEGRSVAIYLIAEYANIVSAVGPVQLNGGRVCGDTTEARRHGRRNRIRGRDDSERVRAARAVYLARGAGGCGCRDHLVFQCRSSQTSILREIQIRPEVTRPERG